LESPPFKILFNTSFGIPSFGKQIRFIAKRGFPPHTYTSERELAAAICPKTKGSSTTGVKKSAVNIRAISSLSLKIPASAPYSKLWIKSG